MSVSIGGKAGVHLGVKDAGSSLDNADSLVVGLNLVDIARLAGILSNRQSRLKGGGKAFGETYGLDGLARYGS